MDFSQNLAKPYSSLQVGDNLIFYYFLRKDVPFHFLFRDKPECDLGWDPPRLSSTTEIP